MLDKYISKYRVENLKSNIDTKKISKTYYLFE